MDPFLIYLLAVNVVTFLVIVLDFLLCMWKPEIDDSAANSLIVDAFPVAGGAAGMLLALFLTAGFGGRRRMNKDNIAWWFLAIVCLIVWGLIAAAKFGLVEPGANGEGLLWGWNTGRLKVLGIYLAIVNVVTFAAFEWDKHVANTGNDHQRRAPEARLLGLGLVGGSIGGLLAMYIVRHKTRKWYFVWGLPMFALVDCVVVVYAHLCGVI